MKSRSHRLAVDQKDDWVEESWTVDCSCGVNFDDGEEMVDCDDCGVWVHTRCSRYVKTDNSFVCDKCKNNDSSEETEVAQLLVELPTKTVPLPSPPCTSSAVTAFVRPFKRSIKDRVHVQGIPGDAGDPDLFSGISAVFGPQLWKCSGYIPKKFNFKYREFPYEEMIDKKDCSMKIETRTDDGAGALLSLAQLDVEKQPEGHRFVAPRESGFNLDRLTPKNEVGKDTGSMKPPLLHFEKRTREDALNTKDRSGKKKVRLFEKDGDCSKKIRLQSPDRGHMAAEIDPHCGRSGNSSLPTSHLSHDPVVVDHAAEAQKSNSKENHRQPLPLKLDGFSKTTTGASSVLHSMIPVEEEVASMSDATPEVLGGKLLGSGETGMQHAEQVHENSAATKVDEGGSFQELHAKSSSELASGSKIVKALSLYGNKLSSSGTSLASQEIPSCHSSEIASVSDNTITGSVACDLKVEDDVRRSEVADLHKRRVDDESPSAAMDSDKSNIMASAAGSVTTPSQILMLMSSASEYCNTGATGQSDSVDSKQKLVRESSLNGASTEVVEDEVRHEKAGKLIKEHSKSALTCVPKSSQLKKISHAASVSRKTQCDLRDSALESSSSPTRVTPPASHPTSEPSNGHQKVIGTSLHESASNLQKMVTLLQSSSKVSNTLTHSAAPSNSPAALSDEELALLLHQELNSSPRVPRVPRMRNAGSLPQVPSPTATSVLMKRTTSTGGKDHILAFSRRKTKDSTGQSSGDMDDEAKKMDRISSPKDLRKQDLAFISDSVSKREADSGSGNSIKKSRRFASGSLSATAEGNEYIYSSSRQSPKIPSDEEKGAGGAPITHRTLPGLLAEIMREGKRMTYEELCNSVLPHWPYLRKHNGERYAYSSHSQAVLDCLRNRHEWARLVDRGPKTSAGRKRRKADTEENDGRREHEEFPKGKRKARKRKRLQRKSDEMSDASYSDMSLSNDASDGTYN